VRDRVIKVQRGRDMKTGEDGDTKTRASVRDVPIHPHLAPLIAATRGAGRVFPVENVREVEKGARELRAHLLLAGVDRPELHAGTATLMPFDPRSLRTTFATWCARSGFDSAWIDAWLGHVPKTTAAKHYVKATGELGAGVFPRLPADLLGSSAVLQRSAAGPRKNRAERCEGRDLNPYRSYPTGT
jgi:integrase